MPFISEEIWQRIAPLSGKNVDENSTEQSIMLEPYPTSDQTKIDTNAEEEMEWIQEFILGIRSIRGEMDIPPGKALSALIQGSSELDQQRLATHSKTINSLAKLESLEIIEPTANTPESATALVGNMKILIPIGGLIDKEAEISRLSREIEKVKTEISRLEGKLNNANFVDRAPTAVVDKERDKLTNSINRQQQLQSQKEKIAEL